MPCSLQALQAMDRYLLEMLMKVLLTMAFMLFASNIFADCVTNRLGKTVCPHTGNAAVQQTNQNGVKTTQTTAGGKAKTKNGMGVATGPNGTTCIKGVNNQGCKK